LREWDPRWNLRRRITDVAFPPPERKDTANNACEQQPAKGLADLVRPGLTCLFLQNRQWRKLFILHTGVGAGILFFYTRQFQVSENFQDKRTAGSFYWKKSVSKNFRFPAFERIKEPPISGI
jgi:hypothetical protein